MSTVEAWPSSSAESAQETAPDSAKNSLEKGISESVSEVTWYDVTATQQGIWILDKDERLRPTYLIPCVLEFTGPVEHRLLVQAVQRAVSRHPALRSRFRLDLERRQVQYQTSGPAATVGFTDAIEALWSAPELAELVAVLCQTPFDLAVDAPARGEVIRVDPQTTLLVLVSHHIAFDGWSRDLLVNEITATYQAILRGRQPQLSTPPHPAELLGPINSAAVDQLAQRTAGVVDRLRGGPTRVELPYDRPPRAGESSLLGASLATRLDPELSAAVTAVAGAEGCTPFMTGLALLAGTLAGRTGQRDFLVAFGWPGREDPAAAEVIGMFMATLVLRIQLPDGITWRELLQAARVAATESFIDADVPLSAIATALNPGREVIWPPVTPVLINVDDVPAALELAPEVQGRYRPIEPVYTKYDLDLFIRTDAGPERDQLELSIDFPLELFDRTTITDLLTALRTSAERLAYCPEESCVGPSDR